MGAVSKGRIKNTPPNQTKPIENTETMTTETIHHTTTGEFCTRSAIDYLRSTMIDQELASIGQRASAWSNGNAVGVKLANQWFSQCANAELSPAALAAEYLKAKESMVVAIFAIQ